MVINTLRILFIISNFLLLVIQSRKNDLFHYSVMKPLNLVSTSSSKSIISSIFLTKESPYFVLIPVCLGTPPQCFSFQLDSGSVGLWTTDENRFTKAKGISGFQKRNSSTYKSNNQLVELDYLTSTPITIKATDTLQIGDFVIDNYPFYLGEGGISANEKEGIFGFGGTINDKDSFLKILQTRNLIKKMICSIYFPQYSDEGTFIIGRFPREKIKNTENLGICTKPTNISKLTITNWVCSFHSLFFNNTIRQNEVQTTFYIKNGYLDIDTGSNLFLVSFSLLSDIFKKYIFPITGTKCSLDIVGKRFYNINCNEYFDITTISDMFLQIGNFELRIDKNDLFIKKTEYNSVRYTFLLATHLNYDYSIIGIPILKKLLMVFDAEKEVTGFYSENFIKKIKNEQAEELIIYDYLNENIETKYILLFLIVFLPIMSLLLLLSKYVLSKK